MVNIRGHTQRSDFISYFALLLSCLCSKYFFPWFSCARRTVRSATTNYSGVSTVRDTALQLTSLILTISINSWHSLVKVLQPYLEILVPERTTMESDNLESTISDYGIMFNLLFQLSFSLKLLSLNEEVFFNKRKSPSSSLNKSEFE